MRRRAGTGISLTRCKGALHAHTTAAAAASVCSTPLPPARVIDEICFFVSLKRATFSSQKRAEKSRVPVGFLIRTTATVIFFITCLMKNWGCGIRMLGEVWPPCVRARTHTYRNAGCQCGPNYCMRERPEVGGMGETRGRLRRSDLWVFWSRTGPGQVPGEKEGGCRPF
jgi:hypothetical protein